MSIWQAIKILFQDDNLQSLYLTLNFNISDNKVECKFELRFICEFLFIDNILIHTSQVGRP